jgi:hypothetical protein
MNAATESVSAESVAPALMRLGFLRSEEALLRQGYHNRWQTFIHREGVSIGVRRTRNSSDFSTLVFEVDPRRGCKGRIHCLAELRVKTTDANWESVVSQWIGEQIPIAKATLDQQEANRKKHSGIRDEAKRIAEEVNERLRVAFGNDNKFVTVCTDGEGPAGARLQIYVTGRTADELFAKFSEVLSIPGVTT